MYRYVQGGASKPVSSLSTTTSNFRRIAELARKVEAGHADDTPEPLKHSPALRALYHNLKREHVPAKVDRVADAPVRDVRSGDPTLDLALRVDAEVKRVRPDGWRGVHAREQVIKAALFDLLPDRAEVERIFLIVKAQHEY
jgi:type I restriction enzyme R subunit